MSKQELRDAVRRLAKDGRAPCRRLLALAEKTRTSPRKIGALCDEMDIRIIACQLGCFR